VGFEMRNKKGEAMSETKKNMRLLNNSIQSRKTSRDFLVFAVLCVKFGAFLVLGEFFVML
jgi:hypothetical protein